MITSDEVLLPDETGIKEAIRMEKINLSQKFSLFTEYWSPKIVEELNESHIKLAKLKGQFDWHHHLNEDEMFLVVKGKLLIKFRDRDVWLNEGEFIVIPKGIDHLPVADEEVHVVLIEPKGTLNTGNVVTAKTKEVLEKI
jgi:mannose-6-phosphate isomerase-like protein (cupin superfamily)